MGGNQTRGRGLCLRVGRQEDGRGEESDLGHICTPHTEDNYLYRQFGSPIDVMASAFVGEARALCSGAAKVLTRQLGERFGGNWGRVSVERPGAKPGHQRGRNLFGAAGGQAAFIQTPYFLSSTRMWLVSHSRSRSINSSVRELPEFILDCRRATWTLKPTCFCWWAVRDG